MEIPVTNNSTDFLLAETLDAGAFPSRIRPLNTSDFPEIATNTTVTLDFSTAVTDSCASPPCGIYEVTLAPSVLPGTSVNGVFDVFVELFDGDFFGGGTDLGTDTDVTAAYSATASSPVIGAAPGPATVAELTSGLAVLLILGRNRGRNRRCKGRGHT